MQILKCEQKTPSPQIYEVRVTNFDGQKYLELKGNGFTFHDLVIDSKHDNQITFRSHSMPDRKITIIFDEVKDLINELTC